MHADQPHLSQHAMPTACSHGLVRQRQGHSSHGQSDPSNPNPPHPPAPAASDPPERQHCGSCWRPRRQRRGPRRPELQWPWASAPPRPPCDHHWAAAAAPVSQAGSPASRGIVWEDMHRRRSPGRSRHRLRGPDGAVERAQARRAGPRHPPSPLLLMHDPLPCSQSGSWEGRPLLPPRCVAAWGL